MTKIMRSCVSGLVLFVAGLLCLSLSSCGGESTNLKDPAEITTTSKCSDLTASDDSVVCVTGYFIDEAVVGLNYSCGKVVAVTDAIGSFICPQDSEVTFSILNPDDTSDSAKKIVLGKLTVKAVPKSASQDTVLYVTPADFGDQYKKNIVRLLQTLRKVDAVDKQLPSRTVVIQDADKQKLVNLSASITANDFALNPVDFDSLVATYISSLTPSRTMLDVSEADFYLKKALHSTVAGSYWVPGATTSLGYQTTDESGGDYLGAIRGISATNYLLATTWNMVDRKGRIMGFGVYSTGTNTVTKSCMVLFYASSCTDQPPRNLMRMNSDSGVSWSAWRSDNAWRLSYTLADSSGAPINSSVLSFVQGAMDRGALAGTSYLYKRIYGVNVDSTSSLLGQWTLTGSPSFSNPAETSVTIARRRAVAPTLDPRYWDSSIFPLDFKMTFYESDGATQIGTLSALILRDGNIISNLHGQCGTDIDLDTLQYPNGNTEFPLGTVAQIFSADNSGTQRIYISPVIIVPDNAAFPASLRNLLLGVSNDTISGIRLRVDKADMAAYMKMYKDTDFVNGAADDQEKSAVWADNYAFLNGGSGSSSVSGVVSSQKGSCL